MIARPNLSLYIGAIEYVHRHHMVDNWDWFIHFRALRFTRTTNDRGVLSYYDYKQYHCYSYIIMAIQYEIIHNRVIEYMILHEDMLLSIVNSAYLIGYFSALSISTRPLIHNFFPCLVEVTSIAQRKPAFNCRPQQLDRRGTGTWWKIMKNPKVYNEYLAKKIKPSSRKPWKKPLSMEVSMVICGD